LRVKQKFDKLRSGWIIFAVCFPGFIGSLLPCATAQEPWWPKSPDFYDVFFIDPRQGWVVGFSGIIATKDGGTNWQVQFDSTVPPTGASIAVIHKGIFLDEQEGWAIGTGRVETGLLFHTIDGGESWDKKVDEFFIPQDIQFVNRKEGWMTKRHFMNPIGKILHTNDGGLTWEEQYNKGAGPLFFLNNQIGWVASMGARQGYRIPILYHTTDGGTTWRKLDIGLDMLIHEWGREWQLEDLFFLDAFKFLTTFGYIKSNQLLKRTPKR